MNGPRRRGERIPDPEGPLHLSLSYPYDQHGYDGLNLGEGLQLSRPKVASSGQQGMSLGWARNSASLCSSRNGVGGGVGTRTKGQR
jgi:hypothetical protein